MLVSATEDWAVSGGYSLFILGEWKSMLLSPHVNVNSALPPWLLC